MQLESSLSQDRKTPGMEAGNLPIRAWSGTSDTVSTGTHTDAPEAAEPSLPEVAGSISRKGK